MAITTPNKRQLHPVFLLPARALLAASACLLIVSAAACDDDEDPTSDATVSADGGGTDSAVSDGGVQEASTSDAQPPDAVSDDATAADATPVEPDASVESPQPGAPGGACLPGDTCDGRYWTCQDIFGHGKVCTQECLANHMCPAELRCEYLPDAPEQKYCLFGPRGTRATGEPCGDELDNACESGLCWEADDSLTEPTCAGQCNTAADCAPTVPVCWDSIYMCGAIPAGTSGGLCLAQDACDEGTCLTLASGDKRCATSCTGPSDNCLQPYLSCQEVDGAFYCLGPQS